MANGALTPDELEQRLIDFAVIVCRSLLRARSDDVIRHISSQMISSATSPVANYGEARAAESKRDFVHKMQICLKELRETQNWLRIKTGVYGANAESEQISEECRELMLIFGASIRTARRTK